MSRQKNDNVQITVAKGILVPAFVMLLVAALTFVTASYAWFSTTVPYNIDDIGMSAGAGNGITVSADCENWSSAVGKTELLAGYEGSRNVLPLNEISPVSGAGLFDGDEFVFYTGHATSDGVVAKRAHEPTRQSTSGDYYAYDLFFRTDTASTLYLGEGSAVYDAKRSATPVSASARVAFVNLGRADDPTAARALRTPVTSRFLAGYKAVDAAAFLDPQEIYYYRDDSGRYVRIKDYELDWDLFDGLRREGNLFVRDDSVLHETPLRIWEPNAATHTASVTATGPIETRAVTAEGYITEENTAPVADEVLFNDLQGFGKDTTYVATVGPGYNKVRVYIWIEGQDADALDEVSGGSFSAELRFVLA